ncbi:MAG TPA: hypothetical protein PKN54_00765 [Candidatus Cloacimonas acidaminovorans]|nr:hypothetical protein [Candidatus Cloacimonas acidaminovorans]
MKINKIKGVIVCPFCCEKIRYGVIKYTGYGYVNEYGYVGNINCLKNNFTGHEYKYPELEKEDQSGIDDLNEIEYRMSCCQDMLDEDTGYKIDDSDVIKILEGRFAISNNNENYELFDDFVEEKKVSNREKSLRNII